GVKREQEEQKFHHFALSQNLQFGYNIIKRPAAGTAAGGATVAGRRHRDGARPATGSHNPQAVRSSYLNPTENSAAPPL
ncbi:hypothetical protein ACLOJK_015034, partial [Asimina triloba]